MDSALHLLGIARKAGRAEVGEEPAGAACRARQARVLLVAADAADNSVRRAARFAEAGQVPWLKTPWDKGTLGGAVGRTACAMLALTDAGRLFLRTATTMRHDAQHLRDALGSLSGGGRRLVRVRRRPALPRQ